MCSCVETLVSLFDNAVKPELLYIGVYDQIYTSKNEDTCLEAYCAKVGQDNCRRSQISFQVVDAEDAKVSIEKGLWIVFIKIGTYRGSISYGRIDQG